METETKKTEVVEDATQKIDPVQPISNIFKSTVVSTVTGKSTQQSVCTNCENSGLSCSVCGYNKP